MPLTETAKISLSSFDIFTLSIIILAVIAFVYFYFKNRHPVRHVDTKAGDEGED